MSKKVVAPSVKQAEHRIRIPHPTVLLSVLLFASCAPGVGESEDRLVTARCGGVLQQDWDYGIFNLAQIPLGVILQRDTSGWIIPVDQLEPVKRKPDPGAEGGNEIHDYEAQLTVDMGAELLAYKADIEIKARKEAKLLVVNSRRVGLPIYAVEDSINMNERIASRVRDRLAASDSSGSVIGVVHAVFFMDSVFVRIGDSTNMSTVASLGKFGRYDVSVVYECAETAMLTGEVPRAYKILEIVAGERLTLRAPTADWAKGRIQAAWE
jgi:hypothetical protein